VGDALQNKPLTLDDLQHAWIYSNLFSNNYGTNFAVTQSGDFLFRYVFTTHPGPVDDNTAIRFGWDAVTPLEAMFTTESGTEPAIRSFLEIDDPNLVVLSWKKAESSDGWILRLWNPTDSPIATAVNIPGITSFQQVTLTEEPLPGTSPSSEPDIPPGDIRTYLCT
jgi:alpha-mannosidase